MGEAMPKSVGEQRTHGSSGAPDSEVIVLALGALPLDGENRVCLGPSKAAKKISKSKVQVIQ